MFNQIFLALTLLLCCSSNVLVVATGSKTMEYDDDLTLLRGSSSFSDRELSVEQPWFQRLQAEDTTGLLRRCFLREDIAPDSGDACRANKICFFGLQACVGIGPHPTQQCLCDGTSWSCFPEACPTPEPIDMIPPLFEGFTDFPSASPTTPI